MCFSWAGSGKGKLYCTKHCGFQDGDDFYTCPLPPPACLANPGFFCRDLKETDLCFTSRSDHSIVSNLSQAGSGSISGPNRSMLRIAK
jgi:hypothetical protein